MTKNNLKIVKSGKNQEVEKKKASFSGAGLRVCDLTNTPNTSEIVERF